MIQIRELSFRYAGTGEGAERKALSGINLDVPDGDFLGIIGPSGAGKSTLTFALSGVVPHHYQGDFYGSVKVNGLDTVDVEPEKIAAYVGSVFQDIDAQITAAIVEDEILFGLENFGVPKNEIEGRVTEALDAAGFGELRHRAVTSLSGGQKQKVAIAAVLALRPAIVVLDEPTGELDPASSRKIFELLRALNEQGMTIVVVEQKIMLLCEFAKRLAVMDGGRVVTEGPVREVLQHAETLEAAGVNIPRVTTLARRLRGRGMAIGRLPINVAEAAQMLRAVAGNKTFGTVTEPDTKPDSRNESGNDIVPALRFDNVSFGYGGAPLIEGVSFAVGRGEFVGLLGENGAGKSTLCRLCNGLLKPVSGTVTVFGSDTARVKTSALSRRVGFLFQNPDRQLCQKTVRDEICFGLKFIETIKDDKAEQKRRCEEMLDLFKLDGGREPFGLSRGERQKAALASILVCRPDLLILDEPTTGLDYRECTVIMEIISRLNENGTAILMVTHDMEVAADYAKRALVMRRGRLAADGNIRALMKDRQLLESASLLSAQIPLLARTLAEAGVAGMENVFTLDEMTEAAL